MFQRAVLLIFLVTGSSAVLGQQWDGVIGETMEIGETGPHWFSVRGRHAAYLVDGDTGDVAGQLTTSMFTPAIRPDMKNDVIYAYGSFYSRTYYGDRTDLVLAFDVTTASPIAEREVEIPAKAAGIGHSGMIGLINDKFIGVWNITPAMSVSIVDVEDDEFVEEIATPGCAAVYPIAEGFFMPCADGTVQYIELDGQGAEVSRVRSEPFFEVLEDPVYDYAVPTNEGWLFMSLEGQVYEAFLDGSDVVISEPWFINPPDSDNPDRNGIVIEADDDWRIGGRQPFAYSDDIGVLVTVMHKGGGQETFEDDGTEIWAFTDATHRRGYRLAMEEGVTIDCVQLTQDEDPLLIVSTSEGIEIREPMSGNLIRTVDTINGGLIQNLYLD